MEFLGKTSLYLHILAGALTLLAGPVAIYFNNRQPGPHRLAGRIFYYAMWIVVFTAVAGFLKRPDVVFFQFLLGIAVIVGSGIYRAVRALALMKGAGVDNGDRAAAGLLALNGLWMLGMAAWHLHLGTTIAFPILFAVFGLGACMDAYDSIKKYLRPEQLHRLDWLRMHVATMLGAFTASTTAFTVNAAHFLPWYLQWFGPTLLIVPLQVYFGRKIRRQKEKSMGQPSARIGSNAPQITQRNTV